MDENKPRRRWLSFGIRDLLWAMVVVSLTLGWWLDRSVLIAKVDSLAQKWRVAAFRFDQASELLDKNGYSIEITELDGGDRIVIKRDDGPNSSGYMGKNSPWRPSE